MSLESYEKGTYLITGAGGFLGNISLGRKRGQYYIVGTRGMLGWTPSHGMLEMYKDILDTIEKREEFKSQEL